MKSGSRVVFRYSSTHEKTLSNGSFRRRMEIHRASPARPGGGALMAWAAEWAKEGVAVDWRKLLAPKGYLVLPRRWVVERRLSWIEKQRNLYENVKP